ncbi:MAG: indolepyruvate ferredoxin oxidoreductase family protein [Pseudomonadales bacterium]|jgi:indolepyruvate ferredoxin oxidoreductase
MIDKSITLDDKYNPEAKRAYMTGIEALVRLPLLQRQRDLARGINTAGFISGYRGSPLGGVDQALWRARNYLEENHVKFQPGINEDLAATAVWGTQQVNFNPGANYDGVFSMWYGKGPGVDRSMDVIKHANAAGTSKYGGVLAVAGDDHACKSSTLPHQSEHMFIGASVPVLNPANVQEVLDLGIFGWELSRYCGCWVALKAITENMDSAISANIDPNRIEIKIPTDFALPEGGVHARWPDKPLEQEERLNKYKIYAAREFARVNNLNKIVINSEKPRLGIITTGKSYLDVMQALDDLGIDEGLAANIGLRVYKVGMSWPLEPVVTHQFAEGLDEILVVEEKRSIIEDQLTGQLYNWPTEQRPRVVGEFDEAGKDLLPNLSELTPAMIARVIAHRIARFFTSDIVQQRLDFINNKELALFARKPLVERSPHYCSGCPHNTSTKVPEGSRAMAGIGCHYMATWMPGEREGVSFTQMGGEGVTWVGQAPFTATKHVFQNLGDGTYFHSGILAIRQAVSAKVNITYKILFNDAVAMTGGQPIDGELSIDRLLFQLKGEGVDRIAWVIDPKEVDDVMPQAPFSGVSVHWRDDLDAVQRELRETSGCTVIVYQQTCASEKRRRRKKNAFPTPKQRLIINPAVCEGCGDCGVASNCLSLQPLKTELGVKRRIDQSACNLDFSCVKGFCPSFVSVEGTLRKHTAQGDMPAVELPEPEQLVTLDKPWNIVATGVGGTGVLTVTSLIAMAAHLEGKGCATMNQTGLAQKFGAVVCHVRVAAKQEDIYAVRVPAGEADLLLGCDLVVAGSDESLAKVDSQRSFAIINEVDTPISEIFKDRDHSLPMDAIKAEISDHLGADRVAFYHATDLAEQLLGDSIGSNLMLMGCAYQRGLLPVSQEAIFRAIELNAVAVDQNKRAFELGRLLAHDPSAFTAKVHEEVALLTDYQDVIDDRFERLVEYQNEVYAQQFADDVAAVANAERALFDDSSLPLATAVARSLFKLMAYKDEYEVARLQTTSTFKNSLAAQFEDGFKLAYNLAPPMLSKKGTDGRIHKRRFGAWLTPVLSVLAKFKMLRGTRFDVFGYHKDRVEERELIEEYRNVLTRLTQRLTAENFDVALEIAALPMSLRGYGHIKAAAVPEYRQQLQHAMGAMLAERIPVTNITNDNNKINEEV